MRLSLFLLPALLAGPAAAQENPPEPVSYRVEITLRDSGARGAGAARKYTLIAGARGNANLRVGERIPYPASRPSDQQPAPHQFVEQGIFIDCKVSSGAAPSQVNLNLVIELTNHRFWEKTPDAGGPPPAVETMRFSFAEAPVTPGGKAMLGFLDDPVLGRRFEVEAVVIRLP